MKLCISLCVFLCGVTAIYGFSSGAPASACVDFIPRHNVEPQKSSPYSITQSDNNDGTVSVTLSGGRFKGFIIGARQGNNFIGSFQEAGNVDIKLVSCGTTDKNVATHTSGNFLNSVQLIWVKPPGFSGLPSFSATVVEKFDTIFTDIQS